MTAKKLCNPHDDGQFFDRYKEAVKELISEILNENDEKKAVLLKEKNFSRSRHAFTEEK